MSFVEHLTELRTTIIRVIVIVFISFMVCYGFGEYIANFLLAPLRAAMGDEGKIVYLGILDKVLAQFQLAFWASIILSSPFWFYEMWRFIKPALYKKEVNVVRPFVLVSFFLFCLGILFGYYIVFPFTFETLLKFGVENIEANISFKDYLILSCKVLLFLGILFQLPNLMLILGFMGVVTKQSLSQMRPYVYTGFSVISALLTPPDPLTLICLWIPLVTLFEIGIVGVALFVHPYLRKKHMGA